MSQARPTHRSRPLTALVWTAALAGLLFAIDRVALGPTPQPTWRAVPSLAAVPPAAGPMVALDHLPPDLAWPPAVVLVRTDAERGYWLGLAAPEQPDPSLWIGTGVSAAADAIGPAAACLSYRPSLCPPGWQSLSTEVTPGQGVLVVGSVPAIELRRIVEGLHAAEKSVNRPEEEHQDR